MNYWIYQRNVKERYIYNLAFHLLVETILACQTSEEVAEQTSLQVFLHDLDQQYSTFNKARDSDETLDAKFASENLELKIKQIEAEIEESQDVIMVRPDEIARKRWCYQVLAKLKEAMMKLMAILGQYLGAVRLALNTGMLAEATAIANRSSAAHCKKELWLEIARELLEVQQNEFEDQQSEKAKTKLKESLDILLSDQSCLQIEDLLPMFPAKTKMREIKRILATRITAKVHSLGHLRTVIEDQSQHIQQLKESQKSRGKQHTTIDPA